MPHVQSKKARNSGLVIALCCVALAAGCRNYDCGPWCVDACADIPPGAIPPPAGRFNCQWENEQIARAAVDKFVIHLSEWSMGGEHLGPDGRRHIERIAKDGAQAPVQVIIAASDDPTLDAKRQRGVIETLVGLGLVDAANRVIIGYPAAEGLDGPEAVRDGNIRSGFTSGTGGGAAAAFGTGGTTGYSGTSGGSGAGTSFGAGTGFGGGGMGVY